MSAPKIEVVPSRRAVRADGPSALDVLIRVTPDRPAVTVVRPPLNLALVLDRSGSMGERRKLAFAKEAAAFVVRELAPADRAAVVVFDDKIDVLAPSHPAGTDKALLLALIEKVQPGGSTALHGGWQEGGRQAKAGLAAGALNRVLLLSDGLANVGESRPDVIANDVHALAKEGVSTTTLGLGDDYNENLLEAMARSGDGNYYYVESPAQLPNIFAAELHGLTATVGTEVTLAVEPAAGVAVADTLNDLDKTPDGRQKLPNLVGGAAVSAVVRLTVPAGFGGREVGRVVVAWTPTGGGQRMTAAVGLTLPALTDAEWDALVPDVVVEEQANLLLVARHKKAATVAADRGDATAARLLLNEARGVVASAPCTVAMAEEGEALRQVEDMMDRGDMTKFAKHAKYQHYNRTHSKPYDPQGGE